MACPADANIKIYPKSQAYIIIILKSKYQRSLTEIEYLHTSINVTKKPQFVTVTVL